MLWFFPCSKSRSLTSNVYSSGQTSPCGRAQQAPHTQGSRNKLTSGLLNSKYLTRNGYEPVSPVPNPHTSRWCLWSDPEQSNAHVTYGDWMPRRGKGTSNFCVLLSLCKHEKKKNSLCTHWYYGAGKKRGKQLGPLASTEQTVGLALRLAKVVPVFVTVEAVYSNIFLHLLLRRNFLCRRLSRENLKSLCDN